MKSPSHYDGKPIGTPTDAKQPWQAGVVIGPDQVEQLEIARKLRNRTTRLAAKAERKARNEAWFALPKDERDALSADFKQRRKRADNMTRALGNGKSTKAVADYWGISTDEVLLEVRWLSARRNRHRARHRKPDAKVYPDLPNRRM